MIEYGQGKTVTATHMEEIINLPIVGGSSYEKVREFFERLTKNFDALQTLGERELLTEAQWDHALGVFRHRIGKELSLQRSH